jgi:hypothetical protein
MRYYGDSIPDMTQIYPEGFRTFDEGDIYSDEEYEDANDFPYLPKIEEDLPF